MIKQKRGTAVTRCVNPVISVHHRVSLSRRSRFGLLCTNKREILTTEDTEAAEGFKKKKPGGRKLM